MMMTWIRVFVLAFGDMFALCLSWALPVCLSLFWERPDSCAEFFPSPWLFLSFFVCAALIRLYHGNVFNPGAPLPPPEELRRLFFASSIFYLMALMTFEKMDEQTGIQRIVSWFSASILLVCVRNVLREWMKKHHIGQTPVLIAGRGSAGENLAAELKKNAYFGYEPAGFLDDAKAGCLGNLSQAGEIAERLGIHTIFLCLPVSAVQETIRRYTQVFRYINVMAVGQALPSAWAYPLIIRGFGGIEFQNQLLIPGPRVLKRILEFLLASFAVLCLWPLFLILAIAVKLSSPGSVFYRAKRLGMDGKPFLIWKFRTMYHGADGALEVLLEENPEMKSEWLKKCKLEHDPRITPLGRFLRKTSLDELPQLFNVLRGEMSMIGPRPIVEGEIPRYGDFYSDFARIKPGITGLWQISGRSDLTYEQRVALDIYYAFNWSVWLDFHILIMTAWEVLRGRGAK